MADVGKPTSFFSFLYRNCSRFRRVLTHFFVHSRFLHRLGVLLVWTFILMRSSMRWQFVSFFPLDVLCDIICAIVFALSLRVKSLISVIFFDDIPHKFVVLSFDLLLLLFFFKTNNQPRVRFYYCICPFSIFFF